MQNLYQISTFWKQNSPLKRRCTMTVNKST